MPAGPLGKTLTQWFLFEGRFSHLPAGFWFNACRVRILLVSPSKCQHPPEVRSADAVIPINHIWWLRDRRLSGRLFSTKPCWLPLLISFLSQSCPVSTIPLFCWDRCQEDRLIITWITPFILSKYPFLEFPHCSMLLFWVRKGRKKAPTTVQKSSAFF